MLRASIRHFLSLALGLSTLGACANRPGEEIAAVPEASNSKNAPLPECKLARMDPPGLEMTQAQRDARIPCVRYNVDVGDAPSLGPADAPITIVMYSDFECPYCKQGLETVRRLEDDYPGKIRFVYKAFPIDQHPNAMSAALLAYSARAQGKFWEFHDLLFSQRGLDPEIVEGYLAQVGLDLDAVAEDMASLRYAGPVRQDIREARRLMVRSTPTFFVNGRRVTGAQSQFDFRDLIDEELRYVAQWRERGVAPDQIYAHATSLGYTELVFEGQQDRLDPDAIYPVPIQDSPVRGPATAPLTVVVFGDFQCPYCAKGFRVLEGLEADYAGKLRLVYKHFPLPGHRAAIPAARASMAAGAQGKFWAFHDALYRRDAKFEEADFAEIAAEIGLELPRWRSDMSSKAHDAQIKADVALAAELRVDGTPTYFVNGRPVNGAQSDFEFRLLFAEELQRAEARLAAGVAPADLYADLVGLEPSR